MSESKDFLDQIAEYLESQGIGYATAQPGHPVDIFVGRQEDEPNNNVTIWGLTGTIQPNVNVPELEFPRFQVIVRNTVYGDASAKLRAVRNALHDKIAVTLPNFFCLYIRAEQEGYPIGPDEKDRHEFSINFGAEIRFVDSV